MLKSYVKIAVRNLTNNKILSAINVIGLTVGITVCLIMLMYVYDATSYDMHHTGSENTYRISAVWASGSNPMKLAGSMPAIAPALNDNFGTKLKAARLQKEDEAEFVYHSKKISVGNIFYADSELFEIFDFKFSGPISPEEYNDTYTVVLSEYSSKNIFGDINPVNQILEFNGNQLKVIGVIKSSDYNSHINADAFISFNTYESIYGKMEKPWNNFGLTFNYFRLNNINDLQYIISELTSLLEQHGGGWLADNIKLDVHPLSDIHWRSDLRGDIGPKDDKTRVYIFLISAIVILLIALFNFVNISSAQYFDRMKEIGVRKVIGAKKSQLAYQFLTEAFLVAFIASCLGLMSFEIFYNNLYSYFGREVIPNTSFYVVLYLSTFVIILLTALVAGTYPVYYTSRSNLVDIIKLKNSSFNKRFSFRKMLIVIQFAMSITLILASLVTFNQLNYMKNADLGYSRENALIARSTDELIIENYDIIKEKLEGNAYIKSVSGAFTVPGITSRQTFSIYVLGKAEEKNLSIQAMPVDYNFINTMEIELVRGRNFDNTFSTDDKNSVILNETAVKALGIDDPIGINLKLPKDKNVEVIGIVKDYHIQSLKEEIAPIMFYINPSRYYNLVVRYDGIDYNSVKKIVDENWASIFPSEKLHITSLEDSYFKLYLNEEKAITLVTLFTVCAILLSALGLFGLSSLTISKRVKEIGIRKVLGATASGIVVNISKDFLKLVVIASLIAFLLGYYLMTNWLENFAYKIDLGISTFLISGLLALGVTLITVSAQTFKAAYANPVKSLRDE